MRVGILTYHNTLNFGALMQCYALYKACSDLGADVEVIDYRNWVIENNVRPISMVTRRGKERINIKSIIRLLCAYPMIKSKKASFDGFIKKNIKLSKKVYAKREKILNDPPEYDKYIIGSDQVWNYNINGMDTTYLMDFVKDKSRIFSFSSSFGLESIDKDKENIYSNLLVRIPEISVRERQGAKIIRDLTGKDAKVLCDPVFLLPKEEWISLISANKGSKNSTICTYFLNYNTKGQFESEYNKREDLKQYKNVKLAGGITFRDFLNKNIKVKIFGGPLDYLKSIYEARYVFTDSFHATVFAILFEKNFVTFLSGNKGRDSRIIDLLKHFNMENRIYNGSLSNLNDRIDTTGNKRICEEIRMEAIEYLKKNIGIQI